MGVAIYQILQHVSEPSWTPKRQQTQRMPSHRDAVLAALSKITDSAKFEDLVRASLPSIDARFTALVPTGVGDHGKTVRDPIDGIGLAWDTCGAVWVTFQATTQKTRLREKLFEDYEKSIKTLDLPGDKSPSAIVALAVNSHVPSSLAQDLLERGKTDDALVYVLNINKLADTLTQRQNQCIASAFLDVKPRIANDGTLREASRELLDAFEAPLFGRPEKMPESSLIDEFERADKHPIVELVGASGHGKTTAAAQIGRWVVRKGGIAIPLSEDIVDQHKTLSAAIDALFYCQGWRFDDSPGTYVTSGQPKCPIIIIVDDLQRTVDFHRALDKVRGWGHQIEKVARNTVLLCTRWPQPTAAMSSTRNRTHLACTPPDTAALAAYVSKALEDIGPSTPQYSANSLVKNLGNDPLLIGLYLEAAAQAGPLPTRSDVWGAFISRGVARAAQRAQCTEVEARRTWEWMGDILLAHGTISSLDRLLEQSSADHHGRSVFAFLESGMLLRAEGAEITFRHDRLEHWLSGSRILFHYRNDSLSHAWPFAWDPYFLRSISDAVIQSGYQDEFIDLVAKKRPEALFGTLADDSVTPHLIEGLLEWSRSNSGNWDMEPGVEFAIRSLIGVHNTAIMQILHHLPPWPAVLHAQMAHGDGEAAILEFSRCGLEVINPQRNAALEAGALRHSESLRATVKSTLEHASDPVKLGSAIGIASIIEFREVADLIRELTETHVSLRPHAICFEFLAMPEGFSDAGNHLISRWLKEREEMDPKDYDWCLDHIRFSFNNFPIDKRACEALSKIFKSFENCWLGAYVLEGIRRPWCLSASLELLASEFKKQPSRVDSIWLSPFYDRFKGSGARAPASSAEREILFELATRHEDEIVRDLASRIWLRSPQPAEAAKICEVESAKNRDLAMASRAKLGDTAAIAWIKKSMDSHSHFVHLLSDVWCNCTRVVFERWLDEKIEKLGESHGSNDAWFAAHHILSTIPERDAIRILESRISFLPRAPKIVQSALSLNSSTLQDWAMQAVLDGPTPSPMLKHMFLMFGEDASGPLAPHTARCVRSWEPILSYFGEFDVYSMYRICQRDGETEWARRHLRPLLSNSQRLQLCPTTDDLENQLHDLLSDSNAGFRIEWLLENAFSSEELEEAIDRVVERSGIEQVCEFFEWSLRRFFDRESLRRFWNRHPPCGPKSRTSELRTGYFVAMKHPPLVN